MMMRLNFEEIKVPYFIQSHGSMGNYRKSEDLKIRAH